MSYSAKSRLDQKLSDFMGRVNQLSTADLARLEPVLDHLLEAVDGKQKPGANGLANGSNPDWGVLDIVPAMMWHTGPDGLCDFFNQSWLEFTGRLMKQELGNGWQEDVHPDDLQRCLEVFQQALVSREPFELEYRIRHHSGEYCWIRDIGRPVFGDNGEFEGFIGTCFDMTGYKQMESALRGSEARFKGVFEHAPDAMIVVNDLGEIQFANRQVEAMFGYSLDELSGQPIEKLMPESFRQRHERHVGAYAHAPRVRPMGAGLQLFGLRKDGSTFPADITLGPLQTENGLVVLAVIRDISERRQAEAAIREREKLLSTATMAAPMVFFGTDSEGVIRLVVGRNSALARRSEDPTGQSVVKLFSDIPEVGETVRRALSGETASTVFEVDKRLLDLSCAPVQGQNGEINGVAGVMVDVTRHHKMQMALAKSEARFQMIFQRAFFGITLVDLQGRLVVANPSLLQTLGYSMEEIARKDLFDFAHPADANSLQAQFNDLIEHKNDHFLAEIRFLRKDGETALLRLAMSIFESQGSEPQYVVGMVEDITAQKAIESELAEVQRRLLDSAENERLHLAQELHDGPLQDLYALSFQLQSLQHEDGESVHEATGELITGVHEIAQSLRSITGELRPPTLTPYGLEKAIRSHAQTVQENHPGVKIDLALDPDHKLLPERVRLVLFRIYQNAISNALRHSGASRIDIRFNLADDRIVLEVQDNGRGFDMPPRSIDLVRKGHFGLAGSIERAESIGGRLEVRTRRGAGTTIRVVVPRSEEFQVAPRERFSAGQTA